MKIHTKIGDKQYDADLGEQRSIAITLLPDALQPNHFGAPTCTSSTLQSDNFIADTQRGGSCNVSSLTIIPHCNGTHTESVSHIVDEKIPVYLAMEQSIFPVILISIGPLSADGVNDHYMPNMDSGNRVISRSQLQSKLSGYTDEQLTGLVIRTLPNNIEKKSSIYSEQNYPVYLTNDATSYIVERGVRHLLVDFPSVDKMYDQGMLSNHRIFWNIAHNEKNLNPETTCSKTITEMVFVEDNITDGFYLCNLQAPEIETDAVPSRPVLYPLRG